MRILKILFLYTSFSFFRFAKKERNAFQKLIQRVTRVNICNKAKFSNGESIEEQKLGMRHFAVGGYPGRIRN